MKNKRKVIRGGISGLTLMLLFMAGSFLKAAKLEYNTIVSMKSAHLDRNFWSHAASRNINTRSGGSRGENVPALEKHHELLVVRSGAYQAREHFSHMHVIQAADDPTKAGPIKYGDKVKFLSLASGAGYGSESGAQIPPKIWWSQKHSRWGSHHKELNLSHPDFIENKGLDATTIFTLVPPAGKAVGDEIAEGDVIDIQDNEGHFLWHWAYSRYRSGYHEILIKNNNHGNDFRATPGHAKYRGGFIFKMLKQEDLKPTASYVLAQGLQSGTYSFLGDKYAPEYKPSDNYFIYDPGLYGGNRIVFDRKWQLGEYGKGWVKFKAKLPTDMYIMVSDSPHSTHVVQSSAAAGQDYRFIIGGWSNSASIIRRNDNGSMPAPPLKISKKILDEGWQDYWINVDKGKLSFGKGTEIGENVELTWEDDDPFEYVRYVGFGSYSQVAEFKDIQTNQQEVEQARQELAGKVTTYEAEVAALKEQLAKLEEEELTEEQAEAKVKAELQAEIDKYKAEIDSLTPALAKKTEELEKLKDRPTAEEVEQYKKQAEELTAQVTELTAALEGATPEAVEGFKTQIAQLTEQVTTLSKAQEGASPSEVLAGYKQENEQLRAYVKAYQEKNQKLVTYAKELQAKIAPSAQEAQAARPQVQVEKEVSKTAAPQLKVKKKKKKKKLTTKQYVKKYSKKKWAKKRIKKLGKKWKKFSDKKKKKFLKRWKKLRKKGKKKKVGKKKKKKGKKKAKKKKKKGKKKKSKKKKKKLTTKQYVTKYSKKKWAKKRIKKFGKEWKKFSVKKKKKFLKKWKKARKKSKKK